MRPLYPSVVLVARAPGQSGDADTVIAMGKDGNEFVVGSVSVDGAATMQTKAVVGGTDLADGAIYWLGDGFGLIWTDTGKAYDRYFFGRLACKG